VTPYYYPATLDLDTGTKKRLGKFYGGEAVPAGTDLFFWVTGNGKNAPAKMSFPGASYTKLGKVDFDALTKADLVNAQPASTTNLTAKASGSTGIQVDDVLAIITSDGRYAKVQVTDIVEGGDFWETYKSYDVTVRYVVFK